MWYDAIKYLFEVCNCGTCSVPCFPVSQNPPHVTTPTTVLDSSQPSSFTWAALTAGSLLCPLLPCPLWSICSTVARVVLPPSSQVLSLFCSRSPSGALLTQGKTLVLTNARLCPLSDYVLYYPSTYSFYLSHVGLFACQAFLCLRAFLPAVPQLLQVFT